MCAGYTNNRRVEADYLSHIVVGQATQSDGKDFVWRNDVTPLGFTPILLLFLL